MKKSVKVVIQEAGLIAIYITSVARLKSGHPPGFLSHCCLPSVASMRDVWKVSLLSTRLYSVHHFLVEKAGVAPYVTLIFTASKQARVQVSEASWH